MVDGEHPSLYFILRDRLKCNKTTQLLAIEFKHGLFPSRKFEAFSKHVTCLRRV